MQISIRGVFFLSLHCIDRERPRAACLTNSPPASRDETMKIFIILGSLNALPAVALGAFGAHGLKAKISPEMLAIWQTGVQYQLCSKNSLFHGK